MNLPRVDELQIEGKRVLVRGDLDVGEEMGEGDRIKLQTIIPTLKYLLKRSAKVIVIGHRGRPGGKHDPKLSLEPVSKVLEELLRSELGEDRMKSIDIQVMENLRFHPEETENNKGFAEYLMSNNEVYINEGFSASHRKHTSYVELPLKFKSKFENAVGFGFHFIKEVENLSKVREEPKRPVVVIFGGAKGDKLDHLEEFKGFADKILVGGRLPVYLPEDYSDEKVVVAKLNADNEDLTMKSIEKFEQEIEKAMTVFTSGPMGKYEDEGQTLGTKRVLEAIASSKAYKVAGGGDTSQAVDKFGLRDRFDWVSIGGGASLEFVTKGTFPGIEAIVQG